MKRLLIVIFTFLIGPALGAEVVKIRVNAKNFRIVLTGQDAQRLQASVGNRDFNSLSSLNALSCLKAIGRCEISLQRVNIQSFEAVQEQLRLAEGNGLGIPQMALPRNTSEDLLTAKIDDSQVAEKLYDLLPGPEVEFNLDHAVSDKFSGKTKSLDLARNEFFMSCQRLEHTSSGRTGYSCIVNAIVPSGRD